MQHVCSTSTYSFPLHPTLDRSSICGIFLIHHPKPSTRLHASIFTRLSYFPYFFQSLWEQSLIREHLCDAAGCWMMSLWCFCSLCEQQSNQSQDLKRQLPYVIHSIGIDLTYNPNNCIIDDICSVSFGPGSDSGTDTWMCFLQFLSHRDSELWTWLSFLRSVVFFSKMFREWFVIIIGMSNICHSDCFLEHQHQYVSKAVLATPTITQQSHFGLLFRYGKKQSASRGTAA